MRSRVSLFWLLAVAGCVRYHPAPHPELDPTRAAADYRARRLDDAVAVGVDSGWDDAQLARAALHFRGEVTLGTALVAEAQAGESAAGARPGVGVEGSVTRTARPVEAATSTWSEAITATVTLELGGKRGARIARARATTLAAGLRADAAAWELVQEVRAAAVDAVTRDEEVADARQEEASLQRVAALFRARYVGGQLSFADLARADADAQTAAVAVSDANRARTEARLALARALAVPFERVDTLRLRVAGTSSCDLVESGGDSLEITALRGRPDIGAVLADYAVAEGDVRIEVARQYPDLTIGPGLLWDEGIPGWVVNAGLPALLLGRNRGPIREAEAHRATEAVRVRLLQDSVTAAVDGAIATCRGTRLAVVTADSLVRATQQAAAASKAAYDRGETGQTEVAVADLALVRAHRVVHLSNSRHVTAGAALDRAVGRWIGLTERYP